MIRVSCLYQITETPMDIGWLLVGGAVIVVIALIIWDNRQMTRRAEREARDLQKPFPDLEKWKEWDSQA